LGESSGLAAVLMTVAMAPVAARAGISRILITTIGTCLTALIAARATSDIIGRNITGWDDWLPLVNLAAVFVVIPVCHWLSPKTLVDGSLDRALWVYLAAEFSLVWILGRTSPGAWVNYGIQLIVFANVLAARALGRVSARSLPRRASLPIALAALIVLLAASAHVKMTARRSLVNGLALRQIFDYYGRPSSEYFFVDRPGLNRVYGQLELVYDDWLYPVFEANHLAEPRSSWLRRALTSDQIHFIVTTSTNDRIDGLDEALSGLGYVPGIQVGPMYVWEHTRRASVRQGR
jgi:hypothetical protein